MRLTKEVRKTSRELFLSSFADGRLDEKKVRDNVQAIIARKPRHYVDILKNYQRLIRLEAEKHHAIVESAMPLNSDTSRRIVDDLKARYGHDVTADFKVNPELIGGLRIRLGNDVWDGSVAGRLARLEHELATA
jgi:F-type H+-transporting ATPase subunit delta